MEPLSAASTTCMPASPPASILFSDLIPIMQVMQMAACANAAAAATTAAAAACNGYEELCGLKYSDITFIGSHNSAFVGKSITHNQYISVTEQLDYGVRFLQAQTHEKDGVIEMCHSFCWELDEGPLTDYLQEIADWMEQKPSEVVTVLLTNPDAVPVEEFDAAFESTGLKNYVFHPKETIAKNQWPTLRELIDDGTRLLVFMDYHTDQTKVDYIMDQFDYFWETPYGITESEFSTCRIDRPKGGDPTQLMGIMNHMLNLKAGDIVYPNQDDASVTNSLSSIQKQVDLCVGQWNVLPNVVLLDWINIGQAAEAQRLLNSLPDK